VTNKTSLHDYEISRKIAMMDGITFYGTLMAAIRLADSYNMEIFQSFFPQVVKEFRERYNNPGGLSNEEMEEWEAHYDEDVGNNPDGTIFSKMEVRYTPRKKDE